MAFNQSTKHISKKILIIIFALFLIFSAGFIWQFLNNKSDGEITSFDECSSAGNPIMESYPEQCSVNGKTFINTKQKIEDFPLSIAQGVKGIITLRTGDCMPTISDPRLGPMESSCKTETYTSPIEVIIKKPKDLNNKEDKEIVKRIKDVKGTFELELPVGIYNMYVLYNGEEYCNSFGGQKGEDCEFTVDINKVTTYTLQINRATD